MDDVDMLVAQAREKATKYDHDGALELAKQALVLAPRAPAAHLAMVDVWYQSKTIRPLEKAVAAALDVLTDHIERASCHAKMSMIYSTYTGPAWWWEKAVEHAEQAVREAPEVAASHVALAYALERHERMAAAVAAIECAYSIEPGDKLAHDGVRMRGRLAALDGQIAEARAKLAVEQTGENYRRLGDGLGYRGVYDEAITAYDQALAIDPRDKAAAKARVALLIRSGRMTPPPPKAKPAKPAAKAKAKPAATAKPTAKAKTPKAKTPKAKTKLKTATKPKAATKPKR